MKKSIYEDIPVGFELNTVNLVLDKKTIFEIAKGAQWQGEPIVDESGSLAPGLTIAHHAHTKFDTFPDLRAAIWAKSEHEFIKSFKVDQKIIITGKIADKFTKRGRKYIVAEYETRDASGQLLMKSRETSVHVE